MTSACASTLVRTSLLASQNASKRVGRREVNDSPAQDEEHIAHLAQRGMVTPILRRDEEADLFSEGHHPSHSFAHPVSSFTPRTDSQELLDRYLIVAQKEAVAAAQSSGGPRETNKGILKRGRPQGVTP